MGFSMGDPNHTPMVLDVMEFLRRFLQHALSTRFMKIRYYGFLNASCSTPLDKISSLIKLAFGFQIVAPDTTIEPLKAISCPQCGGNLLYRASVLPFRLILSAPG
jgi:hypothetical protein